ncbi:MAG: DNA-directed RNA polymerase subunit beta, partial [Pyrinomonadaceae bacterium]|nr:DNA-directed RNA polymerase subunit beta [Pyrinomonadaceae bacterium]
MMANPLQAKTVGSGRRTSRAPERVDFSNISTAVRIPNLIEVQKKSYDRFLQMDALPDERDKTGLQAVFSSVFPISDFRDTAHLDFVEYQIGNWQCKCGTLEGLGYLRANCRECNVKIKVDPLNPGETMCHNCGTFNNVRPRLCDNCGEPVGLKHKHEQQECRERGMTFGVPLKVKIRLTVFDVDAETQARTIRDIKEEEVFFGEIPLMTDNGTFIINGTERVIVSQLHRSPGVFFKADKGTYTAKVIPYRGSWVEFEYDPKNILSARLGKKKILATIFLRALGLWLNPKFDLKNLKNDALIEEIVRSASYSNSEILRHFHTFDEIKIVNGKLMAQIPENGNGNVVGMHSEQEVSGGKDGEPLLKVNGKITAAAMRQLKKAGITEIEVTPSDFEGAFAMDDVVNTESGEVVVEGSADISAAKLQEIIESGVESFTVFFPERDPIGGVLAQTLKKDAIAKPVDALLEIYRKMRPGDPPTVPTAYKLMEGMFFDPRKFDLSRVG